MNLNELETAYAEAIAKDEESAGHIYSAALIRKLIEIGKADDEFNRRDTMGARLMMLALDQAEWSQATFGSDLKRGPLGALKHLEKEAREAQAAPHDVMEYADCLLLLLDASRRAGFSLFDLIEAGRAKMEINRERKWPAPRDDDGPTEHIRPAGHPAVINDGGYPHHIPHLSGL